MIDLAFAALFLMVLFFVGARRSSSVKSEASYLMADRSTSLLGLTATLVMTEFNTATLLSFSALGYVAGARALFLPAIFLVGLLFYGLTVAKQWKQFNGVSVASLFTERYGKDIGWMASVSLLLAMVGFSAAYVKSLTLLFTPLFPMLHPWALSSGLVGLVLLITLRGGLISIIRTDLFSFFVVMAFFPLTAILTEGGGAVSTPLFQPEALPYRFLLSLVMLTMFTYILAPWYGQKIMAARTEKTAFFAVILASIFVFFLYAMAVWTTWSLGRSGVVLSEPDLALPTAISRLSIPGLKGLGFALLFAASATTLSGVWSAMSAQVVGDFLMHQAQGSYVRSLGFATLFALLSLLLANLMVERIFDQLILANIPVAALSFALLAGFHWKKANRVGAWASIAVGLSAGVGSYVVFGESGGYTWYWSMGGIPLTFLAGVIGSLLSQKNKLISSNS